MVGSTENSFSFFHLNVASLPLNFESLHATLSLLNHNFDIIGITETRLKKGPSSPNNLNIENYSIEETLTESSAGGTRLYISNKLAYKPRFDLQIYKKGHLESSFIEIINDKSPNTIIGCIYRHPSMPLQEFNEDHMEVVIQKLSKEQNKQVFLMGDINVDLLKASQDKHSSIFLNILESNSLIPQILLPTRINNRSSTLIDNILHINIHTFSPIQWMQQLYLEI